MKNWFESDNDRARDGSYNQVQVQVQVRVQFGEWSTLAEVQR
ncbi:hypothetical protein [Motilimonas cestriensis]|nr:hypothetical protein [Motilimonas cestriensis]